MGGRPTTLWVYLIPFSRYTWERALICSGTLKQANAVAYVTKRKIALPDAKRDPEMGQLNSPWPTYGGSANYTMGLSDTVWPLHMGAGMPENG